MTTEKQEKSAGSFIRRERIIFWTLLSVMTITYGLLAYMWFQHFYSHKDTSGVMMASFLFAMPFTLGLVIASLVKIFRTTKFWVMMLYTFLIMSIITLLSYFLLREGIICIVMAFPFFIMSYWLGGIIGWHLAQSYKQAYGKILSVFLIAPLILGSYEKDMELSTKTGNVLQTIFIEASAEAVWKEIKDPGQIDGMEITSSYLYKIGMPKPINAYTVAKNDENFRISSWEKGIKFDEKIIHQEEPKRISWSYLFTEDSFPKGSLDDHIKIGGRYFDLTKTTYTLTAADNGTVLQLETGYRINTNFNWYANWWAQFFIKDASKSLLRFYKTRLETST